MNDLSDGQVPGRPYSERDLQEACLSLASYWEARARSAEGVSQHTLDLQERLNAAESELLALRARMSLRLADRAARARHQLQTRRERSSEDTAPPTSVSRPVFSVLITVFDNGPCLLDAVRSVKAQTLPDWEIVIWNDGSSDPTTLEALDGLPGPRIRVINSVNQGVIGARNGAAAQSNGEFLVFLDPDDELEPTYLEKALITFTRFPGVDLVIPNTRVESQSADPYWSPLHFEERRIAYENTAPISTAMRRQVWDSVGGMPTQMSEGFEDWAFWRAAAAGGHRGWVLDDALFTYRHSETTGRDAGARKVREELVLRIKQLNPQITHGAIPFAQDSAALREMLQTRVWHMPANGRHNLVVFVPWLVKGGGADNFLKTVLKELSGPMNVVIIATEPVPPGFHLAINDFLEITPYVYHLPALAPEDAFEALVSSLLLRLGEPNILQVGSPWAYRNMSRIRNWGRGRGQLVDIQFNHVGHIAEMLSVLPEVDRVLVAHERLRAMLVDHFQVSKPVDVMYVAPPELAVSPTDRAHSGRNGRFRVGWLGRNSPEKRSDLVQRIARLAPDIDFVVAGSGLEGMATGGLANLSIVGWVEDQTDFIADCDILLNTSDVEGVSVSAMEALQLGVPVATRDVGGMAELIRDGENGLVYSADRLEELATRLQDSSILDEIRAKVRAEGLPPKFHTDNMMVTLKRALLGPDFAKWLHVR